MRNDLDFRCVVGALRPNGGSVIFDGQRINGRSQHALVRLDAGEYGSCFECAGEIAERLVAQRRHVRAPRRT